MTSEWENVGFEAKALDAMRDIPVRMISFGGSNYNISFLIREADKKKALQSLSDALFNNKSKKSPVSNRDKISMKL